MPPGFVAEAVIAALVRAAARAPNPGWTLSEEPLSSAVRTLITERIDSVGQLEIALLLHAHPGRDWTAEQVAAELRTSPAWTGEQLEILCGRALVARGAGGYRYAAEGELAAAMSGLALSYKSYPVAVVTLIYSGPRRVVRSFADAFRFRRQPPGPGAPEEGGSSSG